MSDGVDLPGSTLYNNVISLFPSSVVGSATCATTWRFLTCETCWSSAVSSWKCVANKQNARISVAICLLNKGCNQNGEKVGQGKGSYSEIAQASPNPSYVDVPLPSSSMIINESFVADRRIIAVSSISAMNVDTPLSWLSPAPTRQRIESKMGSVASVHGTKHPAWAMSEMTPTWRMYVDFPPMFGPALSYRQSFSTLNTRRTYWWFEARLYLKKPGG